MNERSPTELAGAPRDARDERALVEVARELMAELHPDAPPARVAPGSHLERELGLDSLARVELVARVERALDVTIPSEQAFAAERLADLLAGVRREPRAHLARSVVPEEAREVARAPLVPETLNAMLAAHARHAPDRVHLVLPDELGRERALTFGALHERARRAAAGLGAHGVREGDRVALMLPTSEDFFVAFFAALYAGAVPVPIYPPFRRDQIEEHLRRQTRILVNAGVSILVSTREVGAAAALLHAQVPTSKAARSVEQLEAIGAHRPSPRSSPIRPTSRSSSTRRAAPAIRRASR